MFLKIKNLHKTFFDNEQKETVEALKDINLEIEKQSFVTLIGPSGCGKTTLLRVVAGLEEKTEGRVFANEEEVNQPWHSVGFVFQEYALFPWRSVRKNIEFGLEMKGESKDSRRRKSLDYIKRFGLVGFEDKYPRELSGGMKQRVALARTLIDDSELILMDEPFGALDSQTRSLMQVFLLNIWKEMQRTVLFVTHNIDEAVFLSSRIIGLTARPGKTELDLTVELPYPRDVTSDDFNKYRIEILKFLETQKQSGQFEEL